MRNRTLALSAGIPTLALFALPAFAGVPEPGADGIPCTLDQRSVWTLGEQPATCQYRLRADGTMDELVVIVTLRDCFDTPIAGCTMQSTIKPNAGTLALCTCSDPVQSGLTDADGAVEFRYARLGGRGSLSIGLTATCAGNIGLPDLLADFTSPDLNGSCDPGSATTILDLALWADGLSGYVRTSDFDCSGSVGIADLALWASGIGVGCP
jgi:hypothetical protein